MKCPVQLGLLCSFRVAAFTLHLVVVPSVVAQEQSAQRRSADPAIEVPAARFEDKFPTQQRRALPDPPSMRYAELKNSVPARVVLPPLDTKRYIEEDQREAQNFKRRTRGGVMREVKISPANDGEWIEVEPGTRVWRLQIQSPGAVGLRLHLANVTLASGSQLFLYSGSTAKDPDRYEAANLPRTREIFSSPTEADIATIELMQKGDAANSADSFDVIGVGHMYRAGNDPSTIVPAGACNLDASCYPDWQHSADAIGRTDYISGSFIYYCSGALINNNSGDFSPLFLTAAHCGIDSTTAASVHFLWKYKSTSCGGPEQFGPSSNGARFLATSPNTDSTLIEINGSLPDGLTWAGWSIAPPTDGASVTGIHHPETSYRRISFGNVVSPDSSYPEYHQVRLTGGTTEPGSSGSPLFNDRHEIIGELYGGTVSCSNPNGTVIYGKLATAYPNFRDANGMNYLENGLGDDRFGDISSRDKAVSIQPGITEGLIMRAGHDDWFRLPLTQYNQISANVGWTGGYQTVQADLYRNNESTPVAHADSISSSPILYTALGAAADVYYLRLYLAANTQRVGYNLSLYMQPAPTPQVFAASSYFATNADIKFVGSATTSGIPGTMWLEWTTSAAFTSPYLTAPVQVDTQQYWTHIDFTPPNMTENTTYYFRAVVQNGIQTVRSGIASLHTYTGALSYTPQSDYNFGDVKANADKALKSMVITNKGKMAMSLEFLTSGGVSTVTAIYPEFFSTTNCPKVLAASANCTVTLSFVPRSTGLMSGQLQIYSSGGNASVQLAGNGLGPIASVQSPDVMWGEFGNTILGVYSNVRTLQLTNIGQFSMDLTKIKLSPPFVQSNNCPASLAVGASCVFKVYFHPDHAGFFSGNLVFSEFASGQNFVSLNGVGVDFQLTFNRPVRGSRNASAVIASGQSAAYRVTIDSAGGNATAGLACSGMPAGVSCKVRPAKVNLNGPQQNVDVIVSNAQLRSGRILRLGGNSSSSQVRSFDLTVTATAGGASKTVNIPVSVGR